VITEVTVRNFKKFGEETFKLYDTTVLAGPNNAGKTTLLQAIATWHLGLSRWREERSGSSATRRTGVPITREAFTAIPLQEMNLLWEGRKVSRSGREKAGAPRLIEINVKGESEGKPWECGLEFQYANREMIWVRPTKREQLENFPPEGAAKLTMVHIPPFSGIEPNERRYDKGYQDLLIGQGRPGEILRNLLLEVKERNPDDWKRLVEHIEKLFRIKLKEPKYSPAQPYIECEYADMTADKPLDLATAGSGLLQVLLLLAFFYARPSSVLLLDEPDAHLHVILQKETYDLLRRNARERQCQLIIATHSEVLLDATDPSRVVAFIGERPHPLLTKTQRDALREALKILSTMDLMLAREVKAVLYTDGPTDESILRAWAQVLGHRMKTFFKHPYVVWLRGQGLRFARHHFFALSSAYPEIRGVCLLDRDNTSGPSVEHHRNLLVLRWGRYEIENYLVVPEAIIRFCEQPERNLFTVAMARHAREYLEQHLPALFKERTGDFDCLRELKASEDILIPMFEHIGKPLSKKDLYQLAAVMTPEEVHPEVREKLDMMAEWLQVAAIF